MYLVHSKPCGIRGTTMLVDDKINIKNSRAASSATRKTSQNKDSSRDQRAHPSPFPPAHPAPLSPRRVAVAATARSTATSAASSGRSRWRTSATSSSSSATRLRSGGPTTPPRMARGEMSGPRWDVFFSSSLARVLLGPAAAAAAASVILFFQR